MTGDRVMIVVPGLLALVVVLNSKPFGGGQIPPASALAS